jgi:hypothetical protein
MPILIPPTASYSLIVLLCTLYCCDTEREEDEDVASSQGMLGQTQISVFLEKLY